MSRKLQHFDGNEWKFVFCINPCRGIITTENPRKAITEKYGNGKYILEYFSHYDAEENYRLLPTKYR